MRLRTNFEAHDFRSIFEAGLDFRAELRQRLLARRTFCAYGEWFRAGRPVAVALYGLDDNWDLHDTLQKSEAGVLLLWLFSPDFCTSCNALHFLAHLGFAVAGGETGGEGDAAGGLLGYEVL